ncbi:N-6 DNA methylase [Spirosoma pollinicola]|uniref:N-6 DNA methylase n=1 Tax=Spirosoma pollinicola TaxID=2057025 RepID=UPI00293729FA|nr:N-6 DNA methylase [Spirosoma pollinicola]
MPGRLRIPLRLSGPFAIVRIGVVLPHGTLFRGGAEGSIREKLLEGSIREKLLEDDLVAS